MFFIVRGKECGLIIKLKKDIGVFVMDERGRNFLKRER